MYFCEVVLCLVFLPQVSDGNIRVKDLTGDGSPDILQSCGDGSLSISVHVGGRDYQEVDQELPAVRVTDVLVSDLDGDGWLDIYVLSPNRNAALLGDGSGRFWEATDELGLSDPGAAQSAERVDLDADGYMDVLLHNVAGDVIFWNEAGRFQRDARTPGHSTTSANLGTWAHPPATGSSAPGIGRRSSIRNKPAPPPVLLPSILDYLASIFVNDDGNEVDSHDIADGSLTGADISTSAGNVTHLGGMVGIGLKTPSMPLHVSGDVLLDGSVHIAEATRFLSIPGVAFVNTVYGSYYGDSSTGGASSNTGLLAPVLLPDGVTIKTVRFTGNGCFSAHFGLYRRATDVAGTSSTPVFEQATPDSSTIIQVISGLNEVVDNQNYVYYFALLDPLADCVSGPAGIYLAIDDVRIGYTLNELP